MVRGQMVLVPVLHEGVENLFSATTVGIEMNEEWFIFFVVYRES